MNRIGAAGFLVVLSAALTLPGTAMAAEGIDPVIVDECAATLKGENGKPLTVDLGAAVNAPGVLDVGLSSKSKGGNGKQKPLLSLPVKEALDGLGISKTKLVADTAGNLCDTAKTAGNAVGATTQSLLGGKPTPDPTEPPPPGPGPGPGKPNPQPEPPANGPGGANPGGGGIGSGGIRTTFLPLGSALLPPGAVLGPVLPPGAIAPAAPNLGDQLPPQVLAENSGTVEALPTSSPPRRVPLLIAVLSVVIVAALLARTWLRRGKAV